MRHGAGAGRLAAAAVALAVFAAGTACAPNMAAPTTGGTAPAVVPDRALSRLGPAAPGSEGPAVADTADDQAWYLAVSNGVAVIPLSPEDRPPTQTLTVRINGLDAGMQAAVKERQIEVPLQVIFRLGVQVSPDRQKGTVTFSQRAKQVIFALGRVRTLAGDHDVAADPAPGVAEGTLVVPLMPLAYGLAFDLKVDPNRGTIDLWNVDLNPVSVATRRDRQESDVFTLDVQYPVFSGDWDMRGLNRRLAEWAEGIRAEARDSTEWPPPRNGSRYSFDGGYEVAYNQNGLLSILLFESEYTGGMHGLHSIRAVNTDPRTGEDLRLADLFKPGTDYVSLLSATVGNQIRERGLESRLLRPFKAIDPDQAFYLADGDLVIYFGLYEYFPYGAGIQRFAIPMADLRDVLAPRFATIQWGPRPPSIGGLPVPDGFPVDLQTPMEGDLAGWNEARAAVNRVVWGRTPAGIWVLLGTPRGDGRTPRLLGLGEEAGVPVLKADLEDGGAGEPLALAVVPATQDVWAMRVSIAGREPGVWLGYVPEALGENLTGASGDDPFEVTQAWADRLGFSPDAAFEFAGHGYHEPAGLQVAMVRVRDQGETFTVRLAQERGGKRWSPWSVHFGQGEDISPIFMED